MQLNDIAVVITGGGSGLGAATARAMAAKGAKIGVLDQSKENAEKVAASADRSASSARTASIPWPSSSASSMSI
jgi:NAD(P)-dependent dehydrogenase (short-subunit alcohol dehydrogenase family)